METYKRVFVIVLDSLGIGAMPDSEKFGDKGVDTFGHILDKMGTLDIPNLQKLGMLNLHKGGMMEGVEKPLGRYMRIGETSNGKDTMTGHWEMMGIYTQKPFITFTETGFPKELIDELEKRCGKRVIGNKSASGTEIIEELGEEEINTGAMIVYTSADSVMQICGNEETFDLANLYRCCEIARELTMKDEWRVGRVIARPYVGKKKGEFKRTSNRRDYALKPTGRTALNALKDAGLDVIGVGKINDIFCGEGITQTYHSDSSVHGMQQTIEICKEDFHGLCFVNLVDFDALWGHRRNPEGYGREIEKFDRGLGALMNELREDDLLILTADHGNDPTYTGTDHTREYVPFIAYSKKMKETGAIENQDTFFAIASKILSARTFDVPRLKYLQNCISCFSSPKDPSAWMLLFILRRIPSSERIRSKSSFYLLPSFPYIWLVSQCRLFSISDYRCFNHLGILEHFLKFILICDIFDKNKQILVFTLPVDHIFHSAICLSYGVEFTLAHSFFLHINELIFDSTFFEEAFCFLCIIAFFRSENLNIQINSPLLF